MKTIKHLVLVVLMLLPILGWGQQMGSIDRTFNYGNGESHLFNLGAGVGGTFTNLQTVVRQPDGKVIIGGLFTTYNGISRSRIARLNADGGHDTTFNPGSGANNWVRAIAVQSDGKIIVGGEFTTFNGLNRNRIVRLNSNGSVDASFDPGTAANSTIWSIVVQPDGKILIGGNFNNYNGTNINRIARLNSNGSLDAGFNVGTGADNIVYSIALQSNGRVLISGQFTNYNSVARKFISRINTDGSIDLTFNPGTGATQTVWCVTVQSDGKILIGGDFSFYNGTSINRIARLNTDGTIDANFNPGTGANSTVYCIGVQADGNIIIAGVFTTFNNTARNRIAQLNTNGGLNSGFNQVLSIGLNNIYSFALVPDGKIIIVGDFTSINFINNNRIAKLNTDGTPDLNFNKGAGPENWVYAIAPQSDGKLIIGGEFLYYNGLGRKYLARINEDGSYDSNFNPGTGANLNGGVRALAIQTDGKIIIGGEFSVYNSIARTRFARISGLDGSLDASFNVGTGVSGSLNSIVIQSDGKIIIGGDFTIYNNIARNRIARINSNGSIDASFNPGTGANGSVTSIVVQSDGKMIIAGDFTTYNGVSKNRIARLNTDGSLDNTFNSGTGSPSRVRTIALQQDGKLIIGGDFISFNSISMNRIARLNADGSLDNTFDPGTGFNNSVRTVSLQSNGKVVIGGDFTNFNGTSINGIVRLNSNGSLDETFSVGNGIDFWVTSLAILSNEKIVVGGAFTRFNNLSAPYLTRIHGNGCSTPATPTISGNSTFCSGISTILTSSAATGNLWSNGATTQNITVTTAGSYSVRVIDGACTSANSTTLNVDVILSPSQPTISGNNTFCAGGSTVLTSSSTTGNLWSNGATTQSITVSEAGNYSVRVISGSCTSGVSNILVVSVNPLPTTPTLTGNNTFCAGSTTILTSSSTTGNLWSNGATTQSITVSEAGNYSVRVISGSCTSDVSNILVVSVNPLPTTPTVTGTNNFCAGNTSILTSSSTTGNLWSNGAITQSIVVSTPGNYTVRVIEGSCTSDVSNEIAVTVNNLPITPTITSSNGTSICSNETTTLSTNIAYNYIWSNGATTPTITVGAGTYSVRILNASLCTSAASGEVVITQQVCNQTFTGSGNLNSSGNWSTGATPASNTDVIIDGSLTVNNNYSLRNVTVNPADTIKIPTGITLTITGNLANEGVITGLGTLIIAGANNQSIGGGTISNLTVANSQTVVLSAATSIAGTLILGANTTFDLNNNALTLLSTATQTARLAAVPSGAGLTAASNFTVQRWLNRSNVRAASNATGNYYYTGPVVQNQTVGLWNGVSPYGSETFNQATQSGSRFYFHNATLNAWRKPTSLSQALPAGTGVQVWFGTSAFFSSGRTTWSATGTPVIGNFNMPLTSGITGFNLLSNPYPSTIDWDSPSWTKTGLANAIYIYDWVNQRYRTYINGIGTNGGSRYLTTAQGFFVSATTTSAALTATEGIKVSNQVAMQRTESYVAGIIRLQISNGTVTDEMVIANRPTATSTFEADFDALKMMNPTTNIFVSGTVNQSIASLNLDGVNEIPFTIQSSTSGNVTLSSTDFSGLEGYTFNIFDEQTGELLPYTGTEIYTFNVTANQPYRLQLRVGSVTGINTFKTSVFEVYPNPATNKVTIKTVGTGTLEILNNLGQIIITQLATATNEINISKLAQGIYTIRFNGASQKLVVK